MRAPTATFAASPLLAIVLAAACSGAGPEPPAPPPPPPPPPPAETASAAPSAAPTTVAAAPTAAPSATPAAEPAKPASPCPPNMALVPGGTYTMTTPTKHEVTVKPFCMDVSETTADEYAACVKAGKCTADNLKCAAQATYEAKDKGNHPVVCVDFEQAVSYCKAQNKRLASDEEWEWAARGASPDRLYPWGNDKPNGKACWSGDQPLVGTCPVGATPAGDSPQGIHDLAGNVFEWTTSKIDSKGADRVGRGGSWRDGTPDALKANRPGGFKVTYRCGFLGIRCATEPQGAK
jgi:formylglycine-generating enzyme required for sulfatase activity